METIKNGRPMLRMAVRCR